MKTRNANDTRHKLLLAAGQIVQRDGAAALTLDAVAREAGVSKGGLLYHFPSKDALISGMVKALLEDFEQQIDVAQAAEGDVPGAWSRAYVKVSASEDEETRAISAGLIAAVATNTDLLIPLRAHMAEWQRRAENDGIDPVLGHIIRSAIEGLWLSDLLGLPLPDLAMQEQMLLRLLAMSAEGGQG